MPDSSPSLSITPQTALITQGRAIVLSGFPAYCPVTLRASATWADGSVWHSENTYFTSASGTVDLDDACPIDGTYACKDAMGPVWSMVCDQPDTAVFPPADTRPIVIDMHATSLCPDTGQPRVATGRLVQQFVAEGVTRQTVADGDVQGELFLPNGPGPHPAIIYMNGSSGGIDVPRAALFAAQGYACLALGLFGVAGRPRYLNDMPVEIARQGMQWLRTHIKPRNDFVAVSGISRGGEYSLQVAAAFPDEVSAVIPFVPSILRHGVVSAGTPEQGRNACAWTLAGQPLPHLWEDNPRADWDISFQLPPPVRQSFAFTEAMYHPQAFQRACIPVESIRAPALLISGCDDGFWPSTTYCDLVVEKMRAANPDARVQHVVCEDAGHNILYPYLPTSIISKPHAVSGVLLSGGGTVLANHLANLKAHQAIAAFLDDVSHPSRKGE